MIKYQKQEIDFKDFFLINIERKIKKKIFLVFIKFIFPPDTFLKTYQLTRNTTLDTSNNATHGLNL